MVTEIQNPAETLVRLMNKNGFFAKHYSGSSCSGDGLSYHAVFANGVDRTYRCFLCVKSEGESDNWSDVTDDVRLVRGPYDSFGVSGIVVNRFRDVNLWEV